MKLTLSVSLSRDEAKALRLAVRTAAYVSGLVDQEAWKALLATHPPRSWGARPPRFETVALEELVEVRAALTAALALLRARKGDDEIVRLLWGATALEELNLAYFPDVASGESVRAGDLAAAAADRLAQVLTWLGADLDEADPARDVVHNLNQALA